MDIPWVSVTEKNPSKTGEEYSLSGKSAPNSREGYENDSLSQYASCPRDPLRRSGPGCPVKAAHGRNEPVTRACPVARHYQARSFDLGFGLCT
ncbi:hypothetical protein RRF57_002921 [Xylaria bambusicola]|uniref:Uncharacterized protein n=1 Tax=Xylaria bambusicola TaxID=326684 RepID=A0AAN7UKZ3_9PEZI